MKKIKYILVLLFFCLTINVKAASCSNEELNRLRDLANKVEFKQEIYIDNYDEEGNELTDYVNVLYTVSIINYNDDLQLYMKRNNVSEFSKITLDDLNNMAFEPGESITIKIYSYTDNSCTDELLTTKTIKFEYYNNYYYFHKDKCNQYPNFKYCKEFLNVNKSNEEIDKLFESYIKENPTTTKNNFISNNIIIIGAGAIALILVVSVIIIIINKKKKNDL